MHGATPSPFFLPKIWLHRPSILPWSDILRRKMRILCSIRDQTAAVSCVRWTISGRQNNQQINRPPYFSCTGCRGSGPGRDVSTLHEPVSSAVAGAVFTVL
jgi:hypothetical protein